MQYRLILTVCFGLASLPAAQAQTRAAAQAQLAAQTQGFAATRPQVNVNDCTFVRDPTVLRDCIDLIQGQRLGPWITRSPSDPIVSPQLLRQAEADPRHIRRSGALSAHRPALRPVGFDPVHVDQIAPRRRNATGQ